MSRTEANKQIIMNHEVTMKWNEFEARVKALHRDLAGETGKIPGHFRQNSLQLGDLKLKLPEIESEVLAPPT